jgi:aspartyl protease family protein
MSNITSVIFSAVAITAAAASIALYIKDTRPMMLAKPVEAAAAVPAPAPSANGGNVATLYSDAHGHFYADVFVRGLPVRTLVDTGASLVSFSADDAAKLGIRSDSSEKKALFNTANGVVTAAIVRVPEMRLQGITVYDVEAAVLPPGAMKGTLLGMSFIKKLASYESRGSGMVMRK